VPWLGIYVASALLIAGFMRWLGRYGWLLSVFIGVALPVVIYVAFEKWFLVPLPKGPLEDWLGL
jgi:putative tricarboxylic transport membrane protein